MLQREFPWETPGFQGGYGLFAEARDLGVSAVGAALPLLETEVSEGCPDGAAGALICLVGPGFQARVSGCFGDGAGAGGGQVVGDPGSAGEARSRWPNRSVRTWAFMPWRLCLPE